MCRTDPLLEIAMELEKMAMSDPYFVRRGLYPNVDFYSGIVLRALGVPVSMYTVLFAVCASSSPPTGRSSNGNIARLGGFCSVILS